MLGQYVTVDKYTSIDDNFLIRSYKIMLSSQERYSFTFILSKVKMSLLHTRRVEVYDYMVVPVGCISWSAYTE